MIWLFLMAALPMTTVASRPTAAARRYPQIREAEQRASIHDEPLVNTVGILLVRRGSRVHLMDLHMNVFRISRLGAKRADKCRSSGIGF
jgi:hypothetical protein